MPGRFVLLLSWLLETSLSAYDGWGFMSPAVPPMLACHRAHELVLLVLSFGHLQLQRFLPVGAGEVL